MPAATLSIGDYLARVGTEVGVSEWILVDQSRIDAFAKVTIDEQYIHVDPVAAARSPFGGTIAHGFLTLSLLSAMAGDAVPMLTGMVTSVNYGFDRIRFLSPVASGKRVRGRFRLDAVAEKASGVFESVLHVDVEIDGALKPALVADWRILSYL